MSHCLTAAATAIVLAKTAAVSAANILVLNLIEYIPLRESARF